jgi:hypothetical protein
MTDLIERMRFQVSMSMFATKTDLYMEILQQRKEAADALEARDKTIAELVEALQRIETDFVPNSREQEALALNEIRECASSAISQAIRNGGK